jgi:toluene monooxygenase electron transfer component
MKTFQIVSGKTGERFGCDEGETLVHAALRNGVNFSYECNSGCCGACKFNLLEGKVAALWEEAPGLTARDRRKGRLLGCQCTPLSDAVIRFNADPDLDLSAVAPPKPRRLTIQNVHMLTHDMAEFNFSTSGADEFRPGQYMMLRFPGVEGPRAYSMANLPNDNDEWRFIIKRKPGGAASDFLFDRMQPGDSFDADGPFGKSYFRADGKCDIVCIAGGCGLSPIMSVVRAAVSDPNWAGRRVLMFYGGRGPEDICTPQLVAGLKGPGAELTCFNAISDPAKANGWDGECCFIHNLVDRKLGSEMPKYDFYYCGPPPMTEAVTRSLMVDYKVPFNQLHCDHFF